MSRIPGGVIQVLVLVGLGVAVPGAAAAQDVDLDGIGYELGSSEAKVTVVELGDFGCWAVRFSTRPPGPPSSWNSSRRAA